MDRSARQALHKETRASAGEESPLIKSTMDEKGVRIEITGESGKGICLNSTISRFC
jgi:hypothetical protein